MKFNLQVENLVWAKFTKNSEKGCRETLWLPPKAYINMGGGWPYRHFIFPPPLAKPLSPPSLPLPEFTPCTTEPLVPLPCASLPLPAPQSQPDPALTEPPLSPASATRARALTVHNRSCCPSLSHLCRAFIAHLLPVHTLVPLVQLFVPCPCSWSSTELYLATPEPV